MTDLAITAVRIPPTIDGGGFGVEASQYGATDFHAC
jgi:hypothetical protein